MFLTCWGHLFKPDLENHKFELEHGAEKCAGVEADGSMRYKAHNSNGDMRGWVV